MINQADATLVAALRAAIPNLPASDRSFANSLCAAQDQYGSLTEARRRWARKLLDRASSKDQPPTVTIGDLNGILALFGKARQHLKFPAIELSVPGFDDGLAIRLSVAGPKAKEPGSLTVTSAAKYNKGGEYPERNWLGRITLAGMFQSAETIAEEVRPVMLMQQYREAVTARLRTFAADPSKVGGEDGRLNGRCCFCRKALTDERSTAAGYGAKCAENYGLEWGARPAEFAGRAA